MSNETVRQDEIIKKLNELIDLVKKNQPKVENHTHHHYPSYPQYTYPYWYGGGTTYTSGGGVTSNVPGVTWTTSSNDPDTNGPVNPTA